MKRNFLYLAAGALALSACTSENVVDDVKSRNEIGFENVVNKHSRVSDITNSTLDKFYVYGYYTTDANPGKPVQVFDNIEVTKDGNDWKYVSESQIARYWLPGCHYYFFAYNCGGGEILDSNGTVSLQLAEGLNAESRLLSISDYICDNTNQNDLIYADNVGDDFGGILGKVESNDLVPLQFKHLLSKVQAKFVSKFPEGYTLLIKDVKISKIRNVGSYDRKGWNDVTKKEVGGEDPFVTLHESPADDITATATKFGSSSDAYVMPYAYDAEENPADVVELTFTITVKNVNNDEVYSTNLTGKFSPEWVAGYSYVYNIEIDGSAAGLEVIAFTTATDEDGNIVSDWNNGDGEIEIEWSNDNN